MRVFVCVWEEEEGAFVCMYVCSFMRPGCAKVCYFYLFNIITVTKVPNRFLFTGYCDTMPALGRLL